MSETLIEIPLHEDMIEFLTNIGYFTCETIQSENVNYLSKEDLDNYAQATSLLPQKTKFTEEKSDQTF
jgi:hypothetical protein